MLSDSWFRKWMPEFFFDTPVHQWWEGNNCDLSRTPDWQLPKEEDEE